MVESEARPRESPVDETAPQTPPLAEPDAVRKVGEGLRERASGSIDTAGKAVGVIAGLGVFFFGAGYFVEWQRFTRGHLPPEEILPLIPKAQIAAAGVRELAVSFLFGALAIALLGWAMARVARWATRGPASQGGPRHLLAEVFAWEAVFPSLALAALIFFFVPLGWPGILVTVFLSLLLFYSLRLVGSYLKQPEQEQKTAFPLWRLLIAAAVAAIVLSGARQREFPESRPHVLVILKGHHQIEGSYVGSDSDAVLVRLRKPHRQPELIDLQRSNIEQLQLERGAYIFPTAKSLFGLIFDTDLACILPECRAGESRVGISSLF